MTREQAAEWWDEEPEQGTAGEAGGMGLRRGLPLGFLAMLPLLLAYELAIADPGLRSRSTSELLVSLPLTIFGSELDIARWSLMGGLSVWAFVYCVRRDIALGPRLVRIVGEGVIGSLVIGPLLMLGMNLFEGSITLRD